MFVVGVDGCKQGWLGIKLSSEEAWEIKVFNNFWELWERYRQASLILADIPIGLPEAAANRTCDRQARKLLGPRAPAVFPVPCRPAVYAATYDEAIRINRELTGKSIFRATWNIVKKIREVEELLLTIPKAREVVRETHPELCFWAFNGGRPLPFPKKSAAGFVARRKLLKNIFPPSEAIIQSGLKNLSARAVMPDDLLDALAAAVTALLGHDRLSSLPPQPERDAYGLPLEIVYFLPVECAGSLTPRPAPKKSFSQ